MATVTRGYSFSATETVTAAKLHSMVDSATVTGIVDTDVAAGAAIASTKIAQDLSGYATIDTTQTITGDKTYTGTTVFNPTLPDSNLSQITTANKVAVSAITGTIPVNQGGTGQTTANAALNALLPAQTTANGQYLTSNGTDTSWGSIITLTPYTAGTLVESTAPTDKSTNSTTYTKVKEFSPLLRSGTISVYFSMTRSGSGPAYGKVYINGSAVGTERTDTYSGSEDFTVAVGDIVQIYGRNNTGGGSNTMNCLDFMIKTGKTTVPAEVL